jgi:hypothetical protein
MRVVFTLLPGTGSLHPLIPVTQAPAEAGHDVDWCSGPSFRSEAETTVVPYFAARLDWRASAPGFVDLLCPAAGVECPCFVGATRSFRANDCLFAGVACPRMAPDVVSIARVWKADLIVREPLDLTAAQPPGCLAPRTLPRQARRIPRSEKTVPSVAVARVRGSSCRC